MMRIVLLAFLLAGRTALASCPETLDHSFRPLAEEEPQSLCENYSGQVLLMVNTASKCGYTSQYDGLEALYDRYRERGFTVLGFPSNDFAQEPGSEQEIRQFCRLTYAVEFPMFEKTRVSAGEQVHPLYRTLAAQGDGYPQWNFYKYLLDRDGKVVATFPARVEPDDPELVEAIEKLL